jgi:hypothetical protein
MFLLVTIKREHDPNHLAALKCRHNNTSKKEERWAGHCGEMDCPNYLNKCPKHSITGDGEHCNRDKVTGSCPLTNNTCTDQTGAHHTGLYTEYGSILEAETDFKNGGYHVTRIEEVFVETLYVAGISLSEDETEQEEG